MNQTFLIIYRPGTAWKTGQSASAQPPPEHGRYLLNLYKQGKLRFAGPFDDDTGAALVLEVSDETQAKALLNADPAIVQGVFTYELHPWALVPWERYLNQSKEQERLNQ